jgi:DNA-binding response OmpR family regulator
VDVYVGRLRRKLDRPGATSRFQARRGVGYVLRAAVEEERSSQRMPGGHGG